MGIKEWIKFKRKLVLEARTSTPAPETVIPAEEVSVPDTIAEEYIPPCPIAQVLICVCNQCKHVQNCPMEKLCRMENCNTYIRACQNYTNSLDTDAEEKRTIFKYGGPWDGSTFYFKSKEK